MTNVLITIDTELSPALHQLAVAPGDNIRNSIFGEIDAGEFGIGWKMDRMEAHGLKGVFLVDPMPGLVYGVDILPEIVQPICLRGHEVQLHIHTEWLAWAKSSPVGTRRGGNINDFDAQDQKALLRLGMEMLQSAGAPRPIAFRAGNYGADDRTLSALAEIGVKWDTSFNVSSAGKVCRIELEADTTLPVRRGGLTEIPVAGLFDWPGHVRSAQVCALSAWEMQAALRHAAREAHPTFAIVSHSFEMLTRDRRRPNRAHMARFERMCREISENPGLRSAGFADLDPAIAEAGPAARPRLGANLLRTAGRMAGQAFASMRYEHSLWQA